MIDGSRIRPGDVVLGLASNGLHTNGYSLARKVLFDQAGLRPNETIPGLNHSLGEELLRVHKNYQPVLARLPAGVIHGLAHITGGGLIDNLPRVLPPNCDALINTKNWVAPPVFRFLEKEGKIDRREMYQVFNMGIGMVAIVSEKESAKAIRILKAKRIGTIVKGKGATRLLF
jgi:phosphoribosylformylglycinamidine cyclo-ligase